MESLNWPTAFLSAHDAAACLHHHLGQRDLVLQRRELAPPGQQASEHALEASGERFSIAIKQTERAHVFHDTFRRRFYATLLADVSDADLRAELEMFGGDKSTRGSFLINLVLCSCTAYRMQLFLYLKSCGREELGSMNLWGGMDAPAPA